MDGLQRSTTSFRRQGSSGLVWDDKFLSGELNKLADQQKEDNRNKKSQKLKTADPDNNPSAAAQNSARPGGITIERNRSTGGRGYRTGKVLPALEPPSPRVSACGLCGGLGNGNKTRRRPPPNSGKRVM